jgi:hypothetical protein
MSKTSFTNTRTNYAKLYKETAARGEHFPYRIEIQYKLYILLKHCSCVLLRCTHEGDASGPEEMSYTEEDMNYMEAEQAVCLLKEDQSSKSHAHQHVTIHFP